MGSLRPLRVVRRGWPRAECQNPVRVRRERWRTVTYRRTDPISKYREDNAGQVPLSGKGGTCREEGRTHTPCGGEWICRSHHEFTIFNVHKYGNTHVGVYTHGIYIYFPARSIEGVQGQ